LCSSDRRAGVDGNDGAGTSGEGVAARMVSEEGGELPSEFCGVANLECGIGSEPAGDDGGKVVHVRAEDDGLAGEDGFDRVLATSGGEAFADEDDGGDRVPVAEFAGGIDQQELSVGF